MEHKKYRDIERLKENNADTFQPGEHITITEKADGSNCAIRYDSETDSIVAQSRKKILDETENLRGFYQYAQTLDKNLVKKFLGDDLILCGEWLVSHNVKYPDNAYNKMYVFDVYSISQDKYLDTKIAFTIAKNLGLPVVPTFYEGMFISYEHCMALVGKTALGGEYGEGIVIKGDNNKVIKIVSERFAETKKVKKAPTPEELAAQNQAMEIASSIITEARVRKIILKLVDEGIIPETWDEHDLGTLAKNLPKRIFEDCLKEEPETVKLIEKEFGKLASRIAMTYAKSFIK